MNDIKFELNEWKVTGSNAEHWWDLDVYEKGKLIKSNKYKDTTTLFKYVDKFLLKNGFKRVEDWRKSHKGSFYAFGERINPAIAKSELWFTDHDLIVKAYRAERFNDPGKTFKIFFQDFDSVTVRLPDHATATRYANEYSQRIKNGAKVLAVNEKVQS